MEERSISNNGAVGSLAQEPDLVWHERSISNNGAVGRGEFLLLVSVVLTSVTVFLSMKEAKGLLPAIPWLISLPACVMAFDDRRGPGWQRRDRLVLLGLTVLSLASRLLLLDRIPSYINPDEPIFGLLAVDLKDGVTSIFVRGWLGEPYTSLIPFAVSLHLFGRDIVALRVPDGIIGALAVPALYIVGKEAYSRTVGFFASLFLMFNVAAFHLSRTGLTNVQALTLMVIGAGALLRVLSDPARQRQWAILGLTLGLTICTFSSALVWNIIAILTLAPSAPRLLRHKRVFHGVVVPLLFGGFVAASPILPYLLRAPSDLGGHALSMVVWNPEVRDHEIYSYHLQPGDIAGIWRRQIERSLGAFVAVGDTQEDYGSEKGLLDPVAAVAFILGIAVLVRQGRLPSSVLLASWVICTLVLGSIIIEDPPQTTKLLVLIPACCLIAATGLEALLELLADRRRWALVLHGVGILGVLVGAAFGFSYYFGRYQLVRSQQTTVLARYIRSIQADRITYLVDLGVPPRNELIRYLAPQAQVESWDTSQRLPSVAPGLKIALIASAEGTGGARALKAVDKYYPGADSRVLYDSVGRPVLRVWELTSDGTLQP